MYSLPACMSLTIFTVFLLVTFYRDSMLLATMALLTSIIIRGLKRTSVSAPVWISGLSNWVLMNRFGQILIFHNLYPKVRVDFTFTYISYSANLQYQLQAFMLRVDSGIQKWRLAAKSMIRKRLTHHRDQKLHRSLANTDTHCPFVIWETFAYSNIAATESSKLYSPSPPDITQPTAPVDSGVARYLGLRAEQSQWPPIISN